MGKQENFDLTSSSDAATAGIRHIGIGTCSSGKMRDYLKKKGFSDDAVKQAVEDLIKREYIDDGRAGRKVLLSRSGKKQESRAYLIRRLYIAGVRPSVADELMENVEDGNDLCFNLYLSAKPFVSDDDEAESFREELLKLASKRGFTGETARTAYDRWLNEVLGRSF